MQSNRLAALRPALVWAMWLLLVVAVIGSLTVHGEARTTVVDGLGMVAVWISAAVCWLAVARLGFRRREVLLAAAAVTSFAVGLTYLGAVLVGGATVPVASPADAAYLVFYPLMLAALVVAVRRHARELGSSVWLDSAVGSLGATSVLAVLLSPVFASAVTDSLSLPTLILVAYTVFDLLLVAAVAGIAALRGVRMGSRWSLLLAGLLSVSGADIVLALQRTNGTYSPGTSLDTGWGIGLALVAMWIDGAAQHDGSTTRETRPASGAAALAVSSVATVAGLGVLVVGTRTHLSTLAVALAALTLLAAAARAQLAFRQLTWMADLRRVAATTDDLTGLPNRRALYAEGHARLLEPRCRRQALLMMDLNKFKEVNDTLGHHAGDLLLIQVGVRLLENLRECDVLARLGGDEFALLLEDAGHDEATEVAVKLRTSLAEPFVLGGIALHSSVSVGIALFPDDGADLSSLLRKADIAMYKAKASGKGHHVYCSADDAADATRLQMVQEPRTALSSDKLVWTTGPRSS